MGDILWTFFACVSVCMHMLKFLPKNHLNPYTYLFCAHTSTYTLHTYISINYSVIRIISYYGAGNESFFFFCKNKIVKSLHTINNQTRYNITHSPYVEKEMLSNSTLESRMIDGGTISFWFYTKYANKEIIGKFGWNFYQKKNQRLIGKL